MDFSNQEKDHCLSPQLFFWIKTKDFFKDPAIFTKLAKRDSMQQWWNITYGKHAGCVLLPPTMYQAYYFKCVSYF